MSVNPPLLRALGAAAILGTAVLVSVLASAASERTGALIGLRHSVFDNPDFEGPPVLERQSADFDIEAFVWQPGLPGRNMSMRWEGYWYLPTGGPVRVHALADDEARVWIDDRLMAQWQIDAGYQVQETAELRPGVHRIRIEHIQYAGGASISLEWGQPEYPLRRFVPERLFPEPPGEDVIIAAARARTLRVLRPVVWYASLLASGLLLVLPSIDASLARVRRSERFGRALARVSDRRYQTAAAILVGGVMVTWAVRHRLGALGPVTFWNDDIWVVALASRPSLLEALGVTAPVPPGFVLLEWVARRLSAAPGASLQIVPLASAILSGVTVAWAVARLTGSRLVGLAALGLALLDPLMAQLSVLTKPYTLDALVTAGMLALAVQAATGNRPMPLGTVALLGTSAAFLSFPSVFASVALVHVLAWRELGGGLRTRRARAACRAVVLFDLLLTAVIWFVLLGRSSPVLEGGWARSFVPAGPADAAMDFIAVRGTNLLSRPFARWPDAAALIACVGLVWLHVDRRRRLVGWFVVTTYAGLLAAAVLGIYPIAMGFQARVVLFTQGLAIFLAGVGLVAVSRLLPARSVVHASLAAAVLWRLYSSPVPVSYIDHDHSQIVMEMTRKAADGDAVIVTAIGAFAVAVYGGWPSEVARDSSGLQFHIRFPRPLTITLPTTRDRDSVLLGEVVPMLEARQPPRVFFFSTRRDTTVTEAVIERAGYTPAYRRTSTTSTVLVVFERVSARARPR